MAPLALRARGPVRTATPKGERMGVEADGSTRTGFWPRLILSRDFGRVALEVEL
jgi:hypothetical protein